MSGTQTTPTPAPVVNSVVADARSLPDLIKQADIIAPDLAAKWTGKSLIASKSPWGTLAGGIVGWAVSHYALGWDQATCSLVAGGFVLIASYAMRAITSLPITGVFTKATASEVAAKVAATP
jgi:hypothetical protein